MGKFSVEINIDVDCRPDGHTHHPPPPQGILQTYPILKSSLFYIK